MLAVLAIICFVYIALWIICGLILWCCAYRLSAKYHEEDLVLLRLFQGDEDVDADVLESINPSLRFVYFSKIINVFFELILMFIITKCKDDVFFKSHTFFFCLSHFF
jgi:hypothetical protein